MRIERSAWSWLAALGSAGLACAALSLLAGCPGKLDDKELYLAALPDGGGGAPLSEAGSGGGAGTPALGGGDAGGATDTCGDVVARIFVPSCGGTGCHGAVASQQGLDLVSPSVAARVVGVPGQVCAMTLADPVNPELSLIYQKLSTEPPCGAQMPLARPPLSSADTACVLAWIKAQPTP